MNFGKAENIDKPISSNEKFNQRYQRSSLVASHTEFWGNNCAHVILTAEADSLPTDAKKLLHGHGLVGCHSRRSNDLSAHADNRNGHAAFFEFKFGKKTNRATEASRERSAEQLCDDVESVALVVKGSDLGTSLDCSEPGLASMTPRRDNL